MTVFVRDVIVLGAQPNSVILRRSGAAAGGRLEGRRNKANSRSFPRFIRPGRGASSVLPNEPKLSIYSQTLSVFG
jgi:hypothetical protein